MTAEASAFLLNCRMHQCSSRGAASLDVATLRSNKAMIEIGDAQFETRKGWPSRSEIGKFSHVPRVAASASGGDFATLRLSIKWSDPFGTHLLGGVGAELFDDQE